jgi:hypothetical protein
MSELVAGEVKSDLHGQREMLTTRVSGKRSTLTVTLFYAQSAPSMNWHRHVRIHENK